MDDTEPVLTVPVDLVQECGAIVTSIEDWIELASATDACGAVTLTSDLWNTTSGCGSTETRTYLFTTTDACGNSSTGLADYILEDNTIPVITCPEDLVLACGDTSNDQQILAWLNTAEGSDALDLSLIHI